MSTEHAVYTIAHENGIDVSKYLDQERTREVRDLVAQLRAGQSADSDGNRGTQSTRSRRGARSSSVNVTIKGIGPEKLRLPGLKQSHADAAKRMAERVYPVVYLFENSVRDLIELVLKDMHGKDWWTKAVPGDVQKRAAKHKADEKDDPWHGPRGAREIDYVFLNELWAIINHNWAAFKHLFPKKAWVESLITSDMNVSRRVLAHMNPLAADDIRNIESAFNKWARQLQAVEAKLP